MKVLVWAARRGEFNLIKLKKKKRNECRSESSRSQIFNLETAPVLRRICVGFALVVQPKTFHSQLIVANILLSIILQMVIAQTDRKITGRTFSGLLDQWELVRSAIIFLDAGFNIILSSYRLAFQT